ncbi:MAG: type IV pilus secretin PilQ [Desulfuromonadales bacterium]|nr:type IV pilus secretin PilQ [Desulfuromonadales bacterium]
MRWITKQSIVLAFALVLVVGLASVVPSDAESARETPQNAQIKLSDVEAITVSGEGDAAELVIKLSSPATYTSYKTTSPLRLVIDLSQTTQGKVISPVIFNKGNFKNVNVNRYDTDAGVLTRVDVELKNDADAVLSVSQEKPGEIRVAFPLLAAQPAVADSANASKAALVEQVKDDAITPPKTTVPEQSSVIVPSTASTPSVHASVVRALTAISIKDNTVVLTIEGGAGEFKTIRLSKPERYVVDLQGVSSSLSPRIIPINSFGVSSARLGIYPEKVRVVFDTVDGSFPESTIFKSAEGVTIAFKKTLSEENPNTRLMTAKNNDKLSEPVKVPEPVSTNLPKSAPVAVPASLTEKPALQTTLKSTEHVVAPSVEMIDFQVVDGISRVAVKIVGDFVVDSPIKSPGFVTLTIKNAALPKKLQRSLETKGFVSPVLRVTPLQVKSRKAIDTKIRVAMRKNVPYEFRQEGDMLFLDFKNPVSMTVDNITSDLQDNRLNSYREVKANAHKDTELNTELVSHAEPSLKPLDSSKSYKGRKVTLEFADAEVRKIFQLLSEVSNKNFVLGDDVTGSISIKLVNVPWDQALDIILDTKGLDKREDGNIIIIKGKGKFKSQADEDLEIKKTQLRSIELKSETFNINYSDIGGIVSQFTAIKSDRGIISPDARTNKVIVKDIPQVIEDMRRLLAQLDIPERQVMIEARIVEATSTFTRSLGVNWGIHYRDAAGSILGITGLDTGFGGLTSTPPTSGTGTQSGGNMGISFGTLASNIRLDLRLSAAAAAGLIKIVSTPKVATINNKTAKITQGQQVPYTSSTSDKVETKFIEAALALEVTPHINANGTIGMKIDAKNDSVGTVPTGSTAPAINKKQATTEMLLRDGETTVIGGIFVDSDNDSDEGVPFLMDIPLFGKLFKTSNKTKTKTELLIFITPRILGIS